MNEELFGLKPCRFCCAETEYIRIIESGYSEFKAHCEYCGAFGPGANTKATAVQYWNEPSQLEKSLRDYIAKLESQKRWIDIGEQLPEAGQDVAVLDVADHCVDCWHYSPCIEDYFIRHFSGWMPWEKWIDSLR